MFRLCIILSLCYHAVFVRYKELVVLSVRRFECVLFLCVHRFDWLCGEADTYIKPLTTCCNLV